MTEEEYETLTNTQESLYLITAKDLTNKSDRTLLYGYTCERDTWHVYLKDGVIYTVVYGFKKNPVECEVTCNSQYIPDKRLYPAKCDLEFCRLLKHAGEYLSFTTYMPDETVCEYWGAIL